MAKIYKRKCNICGKYYKGTGKYFCSLICYSKSITGSKNFNWQGGKKINFECEECGKIFQDYISNRTGKHNFCSHTCCYKWQSRNIRGIKHHMYGKHHLKETIEKQRLAHLGIQSGENHPMYGKKHTKESNEKNRQAHLGKHHSPKTEFKKGQIPWNKNKPYLQFSGEKNPNWKGGVTPAVNRIRKCFKYNQWRSAVYERDDYICQICGQRGGKLHSDHYIFSFSEIVNNLKEWVGIDNLYESALKFGPLWDINNGRTLCVDCHKKTDNYLNGISKYKNIK